MNCWSYTWFSLALLFLLRVDGKSEERKFRFIVEEFVPRIMVKDLFKNFSCEVTEIRNRSYINCILRLNRSVDQFELDTSLDMIRPHQQTLRIYNVHFDGCQLLTTAFKSRMFLLLAESINSSVNDRLECPLKENFNYIFSNWTLPESQFPSYFPESKMKAFSKFYIQKKFILSLTFLARVSHIQ